MDRVYQKTADKATEKALALLIPNKDEKVETSVENPFDQVPVSRAGNIILEYDMKEDVLYRYYRMWKLEGRKYKKLVIHKFREEDKGILFVQREDWKSFKRNLCEGRCEPMDLRIREVRGQKYCWYRAVFSAVLSNGKLERVRCLLEYIDSLLHVRDEYGLLNELCKEVVSRRFEIMNLIDAGTGSYRSIRLGKNEWCKIPGRGDYDKSITDFVMQWLPDEESRQTVSHLCKRELLQLLNSETVVKRYFRIYSSGVNRWKLVEYCFFREDNRQILQIISDVNEDRMNQERLLRMIQDKENDEKARNVFLSSISREIQNVMNAIIGTSDMLLVGEISSQTSEKLMTIRNISVGLNKIAGDILDFTDITSEGFKILPSDYCISTLLVDVANLIKIQLKDRNVKFFLDVEASVPEFLYGDDIRISQILMNLLNNAIEFTNQGFVMLKVEGHRQGCNEYCLEISVADSGLGMKEEEIASIMKPPNAKLLESCQSRTKGLGIPISRNLSRLMGGDLGVVSKYGQGSVFHITLLQKILKEDPVVQKIRMQVNILVLENDSLIEKHVAWLLEQLKVKYVICRNLEETNAEEKYTHVLLRSDILLSERRLLEVRFGRERLILLTDQWQECDISLMRYHQIPISFMCLTLPKLLNNIGEKKKHLSHYRESERKLALHTGKILVVDDSRVNLEMIRSILEAYLLHVDVAESGEAALKLIQENSYDLVLMDQVMSEMNGSQTLSFIRKLGEKYKKIPIIALAAVVNIGIRKRLLRAGFQDYLVKPLGVLEINRILETYIKPEDIEEEKKNGEENRKLDYPSLALMVRLRAACRSMEYDCAEKIVYEMLGDTYPQEIMEHLNAMLECCEEFAYDEFDRLADELLKSYERR